MWIKQGFLDLILRSSTEKTECYFFIFHSQLLKMYIHFLTSTLHSTSKINMVIFFMIFFSLRDSLTAGSSSTDDMQLCIPHFPAVWVLSCGGFWPFQTCWFWMLQEIHFSITVTKLSHFGTSENWRASNTIKEDYIWTCCCPPLDIWCHKLTFVPPCVAAQ